jgi:hypothetical protein
MRFQILRIRDVLINASHLIGETTRQDMLYVLPDAHKILLYLETLLLDSEFASMFVRLTVLEIRVLLEIEHAFRLVPQDILHKMIL